MVANLNHRFAHYRISDNITEAGVLLHTFDHVDRHGGRTDVWMPGYWWRFSCSLVNHKLPNFFDQAMGGFVVSSEALQPWTSSINCAYAFDAGTMSGNGCPGVPCEWQSRPNYCFWPGSRIQGMLEQHIARHGSSSGCGQDQCNYNEIVVDGTAWKSRLPEVIEAVYFPLNSAGGERAARTVLADFCDAYGDRASGTPLVSYDLASPNAPFRLVPATCRDGVWRTNARE